MAFHLSVDRLSSPHESIFGPSLRLSITIIQPLGLNGDFLRELSRPMINCIVLRRPPGPVAVHCPTLGRTVRSVRSPKRSNGTRISPLRTPPAISVLVSFAAGGAAFSRAVGGVGR